MVYCKFTGKEVELGCPDCEAALSCLCSHGCVSSPESLCRRTGKSWQATRRHLRKHAPGVFEIKEGAEGLRGP